MQNHRVPDLRRLTDLAEASSHIKRAQHDLLSAGYDLWVGDLLELLEMISLEMEWLASEGGSSEPSA